MGGPQLTLNGPFDLPKTQSKPQPVPRTTPVLRSPSVGKKSLDACPGNKMLNDLTINNLKQVLSHTELAQTANGVRMLTKNLSKANIQLDVQAIMIVTKARDNSLIYLTREITEWLLNHKHDILVYVDSHLEHLVRFDAAGLVRAYPNAATMLKFWTKLFVTKQPHDIDLCITLGGDGTVLYVLKLFQQIVPPVLSFALGSLGFLTNFRFEDFHKAVKNVVDSGVRANLRMRFTCRVYDSEGRLKHKQQVLNELVVDKGPCPNVTNLKLYGDGSLLTVAQADGLIIATPTGSTAYSLSAGGSLVHPGVNAISVTPVCPHTLSFRPILLPDSMCLKVEVPVYSRATAWASFDGKVHTELNKGDYVTVQASSFPFPTVKSSKTEYFDSVSQNLNWNVREQQKPFAHHLTGNTKTSFERSNQNDEAALHGDYVEDTFDIEYSDSEYSSAVDFTSSPICELEDKLESAETTDYYAQLRSNINDINTSPILDTRTCYAHPNATILLIGETLETSDSSDLKAAKMQF